MKVIRPKHLLKNERVIGTDPPLATLVSECWNRRLNFYTGRTLTHTALNTEQEHHARHLAIYGRTLSPGVVRGLELSSGFSSLPSSQPVNDTTVIPPGKWWLQVEPGLGVTLYGETAFISLPMRIEADKLPVVDQDPANPILPRGAGVVVLQPIVAEYAGSQDSTDPCEIDPADDAFADWQLIEGCRLAWFPWPENWLPLPLLDDRFRNHLAHLIFEYEVTLTDDLLPWEKKGVPLGLVYITDLGNVEFVDRYAVVRQGGAPVARRSLIPDSGNPFIWQARIQALSDHIQDLLNQGKTIEEAPGFIRYLPPVGVLPVETIDLFNKQTRFFPSQYDIEAVPIPLEQFEVALDASASMAPFDFHVPDRIKVFVPVPQELYEPGLLKTAAIDPIFWQTINELLAELGIELGKRQALRDMGPTVEGAIDKELIPSYPDPDPDVVPGEEIIPQEVEGQGGRDSRSGRGSTDSKLFHDRTRQAVQSLYIWLKDKSPLSEDEYNLIHPDNLGTEDFMGIKPFIDKLVEKIDNSNNKIDFGFLRVQTDIYRVRQMMLGNVEATRLATSPVLANIAKGETSYATEQTLKAFFNLSKQTQTNPSKATNNPGNNPGDNPNSTNLGLQISSLYSTPTFSSLGYQYLAPIETGILPGIAEPITQQTPLVGAPLEFRTTTIAERIEDAPGPEAKNYAVATKVNVFSNLAALPINVSNLDITIAPNDTAILAKEEFDQLIGPLQAVEKTVLNGRLKSSTDDITVLYLGPFTRNEINTLGNNEGHLRQLLNQQIGKNRRPLNMAGLPGLIYSGLFDPDPLDGDEAAFLSVGVAALENTIAALRVIEGRINGYNQAKSECEKTLKILEEISSEWQKELLEVDDMVAELRHDALVAYALLEEEKARIQAINDRRREILENHVSFIGYVRPRTTSLQIDVPAVKLYGIYKDPVPACLKQDQQAPEELQNMLDLFREVPLKWLPNVKQLVIKLNKLAVLKNVFLYAKQKAQLQISQPVLQVMPQLPVFAPTIYGQTINKMLTAYKQTTYNFVQQRSKLNLQLLDTMTWKEASKKAQEDLSLADLIEAGKGQSQLAQRATREMENIEDVAVCLYLRCGDIMPAIRLGWAQEISEFDNPVSLQSLEVLPNWDKVDFEMRRDLQRLVDWLFSRIDREIPDAVSLMNDLVRVCILLASHAPVSSIINGHVYESTTGKVGDIINLVMDKGKANIGMRVAIFSGPTVAVQGIVEDLSRETASMRVTLSKTPTFNIGQGARAHFYMPGIPMKLS